jgi:acetyl esterase/lipase
LTRAPSFRTIIAAFIVSAVVATDASAQTDFYAVQRSELRGRPGSIIRTEQLPYAPNGASAYRVLYRSTGMAGEPIAVSGIVVVPAGPVPDGGRPIAAWAHPTTGVVPRCAPSLRERVFGSIQGLADMLTLGFVVTATDYPGLGAGVIHPYLVGVSEGRAVLDSVRAARLVPGANTGGRFAVWGHSQGGQAALFSASLARAYAPELALVGVAAAAPATDLATLLDDDIHGVIGRILASMTLYSWARVYHAPVDRVVAPSAMPTVDRVGQDCSETVLEAIEIRFAERPLQGDFLTVDHLTQVEPWRSLIKRNTPGPTPRAVPIFISQSNTDKVVRPQVTQDYMGALCRNGSRVRFYPVVGESHAFTGYRSASAAVAWMGDRFAGAPVPSDCTR